MPKSYWPYAFLTAVYLINCLSTPLFSIDSPFQKLFGAAPNYKWLRVFGSLCFPWLRPYTSHKLDDRSVPCIFMGYSLTQSAYYCLHLSTSWIYTSRHVKFVEYIFPFSDSSRKKITNELTSIVAASPPVTRLQLPMGNLPCSDLYRHNPTLSPPLNTTTPSSQVLPFQPYLNSLPISTKPTAQNGPTPTAQPTFVSIESTAHTQNGLQPTAQQSQPTNSISTQQT